MRPRRWVRATASIAEALPLPSATVTAREALAVYRLNHSGTAHQARSAAVATLCVVLMMLLAGCAEQGHEQQSPPSTSGPRALTSTEAQRLAVMRFNSYQAGARSVDAAVISARGTIALRGWIDTTTHQGYALVVPDGVGSSGFLTRWTSTEVGAQSYSGATPPLPAPTTGWESTELTADASVLAAAQLLLISLSSDRPDNPQLLLQSTAQWLRADTLDGVSVDVMSGPVNSGATSSGLHYWVDDQGKLLYLEARLDGEHWSTFDFADTPDVTF